MHILFVTGEYPPQEGGVGAYTAELAGALAAHGARVSVVTGQDFPQGGKRVAGDAESVAPLREVLAGRPVEIAIFRTVPHWGWSMRGQVADLAREISADWIHVQYQTAAFAMHPAINVAPGGWRKHRAVAWTYHDLRVPYLLPKAGARLRRWVTRRPAATADLVIVTNEGDRQQLAPLGIRHLASVPIGSNITGRTLTPERRAARRAQRGYGPEDRLVAYFGFLNRSKGGLTLIRTLERLAADDPAIKLLMIGERVGASDPTNFAYLQEVEAEIAARGLTERVQWTGRQDDADVAADLNACDVLLMPYEDGASLRRGTLMAGLANGCAIVTTTPQAPLPELVMERDLLYAAPDNDTALARMVRRVLDNQWLAEKLRTNARERSRLFAWDAIAQRHLELYAAAGRP